MRVSPPNRHWSPLSVVAAVAVVLAAVAAVVVLVLATWRQAEQSPLRLPGAAVSPGSVNLSTDAAAERLNPRR